MRSPCSRALLLIFFMVSAPVLADERILEFRSDIVVAADSSMMVTETIRVRAEGDLIKRGIYRDFPTDYRDGFGNRYRVGFEFLGARRDGSDEPWHLERMSNGVRVYLGEESVRVTPGSHSYSLRYRTNRQLGYFAGHDELYWNVTGNGWAFAMDEVSASVQLPDGIPGAALELEGYTGTFGSRERAYAGKIVDARAEIRSTRVLEPGEGLTLVLRWPKGYVTEPGILDRLGYLLRDNASLLVASIALLGSLVYLSWAWLRFGRDPRPGVIFPHYEPPPGLSPASARYVSRMSYDDKTLTAAVINLAVKGYLQIDNSGRKYALIQRNSALPLAPGEAAVIGRLFSDGAVLELDDKNHRIIAAARAAHLAALKRDFEKIYFLTNSRLLIPSILGTALGLFFVIGLGDQQPLPFVVLAGSALLHFLFYGLMRAPTPKGRSLLDKLDGFRMYLEVAEKADLNLRNPPAKTPELFERYLPFALALGVEQDWAEQFAGVFAAMRSPSGGYQPRWYRGDFNPSRMSRFASSVGGSLSSAISSAGTPPGSSSGSGGSSGGGGGGGGGGGW